MLFSALPDRRACTTPSTSRTRVASPWSPTSRAAARTAIVADGLIALEHLEHRGAAGAEPNSGDGAGILIQLPVELLREVVDFELPAPRPRTAATPSPPASASCRRIPSPARPPVSSVEAIADEEGLQVLGWREVPVDPDGAEVGVTALGCMPYMAQLFVSAPERNGIGPAASTSTGGSTRCANAPSATATCTSRRCPAAPWPTRACSRQCSCPNTFRICATNDA